LPRRDGEARGRPQLRLGHAAQLRGGIGARVFRCVLQLLGLGLHLLHLLPLRVHLGVARGRLAQRLERRRQQQPPQQRQQHQGPGRAHERLLARRQPCPLCFQRLQRRAVRHGVSRAA